MKPMISKMLDCPSVWRNGFEVIASIDMSLIMAKTNPIWGRATLEMFRSNNPEIFESSRELISIVEAHLINLQSPRPKPCELVPTLVMPKPRPKLRRPSVYFVMNPLTGLIKIGFSDYFEQRLRSLQFVEKTELKTLLTITGRRDAERELHAKFAHLRERGEWFRPGDDLLKFIETKTA